MALYLEACGAVINQKNKQVAEHYDIIDRLLIVPSHRETLQRILLW
jgi:hypothetical protein